MLLLGAGALVIAMAIVVGTCMYYAARRRSANRRAAELVRQLLTPDEFEWLRTRGYLDVPSRSTPGRIYRIPAQPGFVTVLDARVPVMWLCSQPTHSIPPAEYVLLHKLLLEGAEAEYWTRANRFSGLPFTLYAFRDAAQYADWPPPSVGAPW